MKKKNIFKSWFLKEVTKPFFFKSLFYNYIIEKNLSPRLSNLINDPWNGDSSNGMKILKGFVTFQGETINFKNSIWNKSLGSSLLRNRLHSFEWVRDLKALGTNDARIFLRKSLNEWIRIFGNWSEDEWRGDIVGKRICSLLGNLSFYCVSAESQFQSKILRNIIKQGNHLITSRLNNVNGFNRIFAIKGIILVSICFKVLEKNIFLGLKLLNEEINNQVLPDGCHFSKAPSKHFEFLKNLIDIRHYLAEAKIKIPNEINELIFRMSPVVKFFRSGDGSLATFNNSNFIENDEINKVLIRSNSKLPVPNTLINSGFQKISERKINFIMDCGNPTKEKTCASSLSFEFAYGKNQIVVNCGSPYINNKKLTEATRSTSAHSTISIDNINSSDIVFKKNQRIAKVWSKKKIKKNCFWIESAHSGYSKNFGIIHSRKIHVDTQKKILRGQDTLFKSKKDYAFIPKKYFLRFHLHPSIELNLTGSKRKAILRLKDGTGFEFICSESKLEVNESIYLNQSQKFLKTSYILVKDQVIPEKKIKWLFKLV